MLHDLRNACHIKEKKRITRPLTIVIYYFTVISLCSPLFASDTTLHHLVKKFDRIDSGIHNGNGYSTETNEKGNLAWGESSILLSYLDMYEGTSNVRYLAKFVTHAERIIANTDKNRNIKDYKGNSSVAWSSTKYSINGERVVWLVHTGMITYPLARFALIVKSLSLEKYRSNAKNYQEVVVRSLELFEKDWCVDSTNSEGFYRFEEDAPIKANQPESGIPLPFNQQLAAGKTLILLFQLIGNTKYRNKAEKLARHFKNRLRLQKNNTYVWDYWYGKGYPKFKAVEDVSHGAIDIEFAILAYKNGLVFAREDIHRLVFTYNNTIVNNGTISRYVDGSGKRSKILANSGWLELTEYDCSILNHYVSELLYEKLPSTPFSMSVLAKSIKYYQKCITECDSKIELDH